MAKKQVQLQQEVETDEEWEELVMRGGLILVDVYSDWSGPCSGMMGNLRKLKLEQGGETLVLAAAKNDHIKCLRRFRNKSRPTWMFIANQRVVNLVTGSNAPSLTKIILDELHKTKAAIEAKEPRKGIDYDQMTEEEQAIADREREEQEEQDRIEREERERATNERRELVVENLKESMNDFNFVVVWPHVKSDGLQQVMAAIKDLLVASVGKPVNYQFTENDIYEMFYYSDFKYNEEEIKELCSGEVTALLFSLSGAEEGEMVQMFLEKMYGSVKHPPGDEDSLAVRLSKEKKIVKVHTPLEEPTPVASAIEPKKSYVMKSGEEEQEGEGEGEEKPPPEKIPTLGALALPTMTTAEDIEIPEDEEDVEIIHIPAIYVPPNENCKILAMRILFPAVTSKFDLPEPEPIPPHLIVAFDTTKKGEVMELVEQYPEETMFMGFFTSDVAGEAQLICKKVHQFERMAFKPFDARLVIQVNKKKSEPLLSYSALGPVYVSPNLTVGEKEAAIFFPEGYGEPESEPESETDIEGLKSLEGSAESEEGEGGSEEEEGEEEMEDIDVDDDDMDIFGGMGMDMGMPPKPSGLEGEIHGENVPRMLLFVCAAVAYVINTRPGNITISVKP